MNAAISSRARFARLTLLAAALAGGLLACAVLLAALAAPARGAPLDLLIYPGAAPCDTSLQACIDGASPGDTIVIQPGTYITSLTLTKAVSLTGVASDTVILQALPAQRVLTVTGAGVDSSVVISGLTFTGGDGTFGGTCFTNCGGGGIGLFTGARVLLANLIITNNHAVFGGGVRATGPLVISNVDVISNTATGDGAGVRVNGAVTLTGGLFQHNDCTQSECWGGALFAGSTVAISGTHFISNTARTQGGAVYSDGPVTLEAGLFQGNACFQCLGGGLLTFAQLTVSDTAFVDNWAIGDGGGVWAGNATFSGVLFQGNRCSPQNCKGGGLFAGNAVAISGTQFISNTAVGPDGFGGGLYHMAGAGYITNSLFASNTASVGSAVHLASPHTVSLVHLTIAAPDEVNAPAVSVYSGNVGISNTLFANYSIGITRTAGTVSEDYNLFANVATHIVGGVASGGHSLAGAAGFADPASGDYHLTSASDAIDAGTDAGVSVDFDGEARPLNDGFDIGYDEHLITAWRLYLPLILR